MPVNEYAAGSQRLSKDVEEDLVNRLYAESVARKKQTLEELHRRFYPVAEPRRLPPEVIKRSVERQADQEAELRRMRRAEAAAAAPRYGSSTATGASSMHGGGGSGKKMSPEELEESVKRMYDETVRKKNANLEESKRRYAPKAVESKRVPKEELQEWVEQSSKPKKTEYTIEEVNKIYGL